MYVDPLVFKNRGRRVVQRLAGSKLSGSTCNLLDCCPRAYSAGRCWMPCQFCLGLPDARLNPASLLHSWPLVFIQPAYHEASPVILQRGRGGGGSSSRGSSSSSNKNDNNINHSKQSGCGVAFGPTTRGVDFYAVLISIDFVTVTK